MGQVYCSCRARIGILGAKLEIPALTRGKKQLSKEEAEKTGQGLNSCEMNYWTILKDIHCPPRYFANQFRSDTTVATIDRTSYHNCTYLLAILIQLGQYHNPSGACGK